MNAHTTLEANRHTIDRLKLALDKCLNPSECEKGGSDLRRLLDLLKARSVKLNDLYPVTLALDEIIPKVVSGAFKPSDTFQTHESLAPLVGDLMADTGLKEVQAHLKSCVAVLRSSCPKLVQDYPNQFS